MAMTMARVSFLALLVLSAIIANTEQSVSVEEEGKVEVDISNKAEPSPPAKCPIPDSTDKLEVGSSRQADGKCVLYKCQMKGKNPVTITHSCVIVKPGEGCDVKDPDVSLPYPKCCPVTRCSKGRK